MVALIAGWVVTEVGRQPWVVYRVMTTEAAVTGARGIPVGYAALAASYLVVGSRARVGAEAARPCTARRSTPPVWSRCRSMLQALPLVFVLAGLALYTVLGGADLGAGFWQLASSRSPSGEAVREHAHRAMAPVWEANHVWLIFVLTVFWTAYPSALASIASTLAVPLFIALLGIVFRGAAYALRAGAETPREAARIDTVFALSSILVPFALGAAIGGVATDRVPVGNATGDLWSSWLNATSIFIGALAVVTSAHLAAVFLAADAAHDGEHVLEQAFRQPGTRLGCRRGGIRDHRHLRHGARQHTTRSTRC